MRCKVCTEDSGKKVFCQLHSKAHENIVQAYAVWKKGLRISWEDYLRRIRDNSLTGEWAKEVAKYLTNNNEEKGYGKKS